MNVETLVLIGVVLCVIGLLGVGWQITFMLGEMKLMRDVITYRLTGVEKITEPPPWIEKPAIGDIKFHIPNILKAPLD